MDLSQIRGLMESYQDVYLDEATAMAKRGLDEPAIRTQIAKSTGGGQAADRATALENKPTYGNNNAAQQRQKLAAKQRGDFRNTTSSNPGLHVGQHKATNPADKAKQAARGAQRGALTPNERKQLNMGDETFDVFDTVLEFLYVEGYAETLEEAEWMMANVIDEEAIEIILGEEQLDEISQKLATKAYAERRTGEFEGDDSPERVAKTDKLEKRIKKKFGEKAAEHADEAAAVKTFGRKDASGRLKQSPKPRIEKSDYRTTQDGKMHKQDQKELKTELRIKRDRRLRAARADDTNEQVDIYDTIGEAQAARENPEKYEREQAKKSAPVRGERTPMPPRGDKRREDFEKWYAKHVR